VKFKIKPKKGQIKKKIKKKIIEEVVEEKQKKPEKPKSPRPDIIKVFDLKDDIVYSVRIYGRRTCAAQWAPASGREIKRGFNQLFDFGAVRYYVSEATNEISNPLERHAFLLRAPEGHTEGRNECCVAVKYHEGEYVPPKSANAPRIVFRASKRNGKFKFYLPKVKKVKKPIKKFKVSFKRPKAKRSLTFNRRRK
jgi:hypothetical protein